MADLPDFLSTSDVARKLGVSPRWVSQLAAEGRLASYKLGDKRALRFIADDVLAFVEGCRTHNNHVQDGRSIPERNLDDFATTRN